MTTFVLDARHLSSSGGDTGADRVIRGLAHHGADALGGDERLVILGDADRIRLPSAHPRRTVLPVEVPPAGLAQHLLMPRLIADLAPAVWLYPQYDLPLVPAGVASVAIVFDLTPLNEPDYFGEGRQLRGLAAAALMASTCARADVIATTSFAVADELASRFPECAGKLVTAHAGPSLLPPPRRQRERSRSRLVYVGNHRPHKRIPLLIRAFARARQRHPALELVLAGRPDPRFTEAMALLDGPLGDGVTFMDTPSDEQVIELIASAAALVFPSIGEGFGFPVVEAYSVGTPAVVSNVGSLPEVAGEAALHLPADDEGAWADGLVRLATDDALWRALQAQTGPTLARFSWPSYAAAMIDACRRATSARGGA